MPTSSNPSLEPGEPGAGRQFLPSLPELIDRLSIDQIKEVLLPDTRDGVAEEMKRLENDIDLLTSELDLKASARLMRKIIVLAQINLHIWYNKDQMQSQPEHYSELLTLAHQLNGIRNRIKNSLMDDARHGDEAVRHTNVETDGLAGWDISI